MKADALLPQPPGGTAPGAALSVAVHVGLVAALALSVNWRMRETEVVAAELWSAVPQVAAPRAEAPVPAPAPPPPPAPAPAPVPAPPPAPAQQREADIATERAEKKAREDREREAAERQKKQREADEQKRREAAEAKKAEAERAEKLREEQMKRMLGSLGGAGAPTSPGSAERDAAPSQDYVNRLIALLRQNVTFTDQLSGNPAVEIEVRAGSGGTIISRRVVRSSGVPEWDEAALRAIDKTGTLPRQADGRVPQQLVITFRPKA